MRPADHIAWYNNLLADYRALHRHHLDTYSDLVYYDDAEASAWVTEAGAALAAVFPYSHPNRQRWEQLLGKFLPGDSHGGSFEQMYGVFLGAVRQIEGGRLGSLIDGIRVETEDDLLDQASALLTAHYLVAATVIAGGALETHLRYLVAKLSLQITGEGSISKYDGAIAKARNDGSATIYPATDSKQVIAWGGMRNDAAHEPGAYNRTDEDVRRMIEGIRGFILRTA